METYRLACGCIAQEGNWYISARDMDFDQCLYVVKRYPEGFMVQHCTWLYPLTGEWRAQPYGLPYYIPKDDLWCDCKVG